MILVAGCINEAPGVALDVQSDPAAFTCTPTHIWDGNGPIWCAEGPRIRLSRIAAREMDGTFSPGHPCPVASAEEARDALVEFLGGPRGAARTGHILVESEPLSCVAVGSAGGNRTAAWCYASGVGDLSWDRHGAALAQI